MKLRMFVVVGEVKTLWLSTPNDKHREMELLESVSFIPDREDPSVLWTVPAGSRIDGASIPGVLWNLIGSPFVGKYRRASVIHDFHCATAHRPGADPRSCPETSQDAHTLFCNVGIQSRVPLAPSFAAAHGPSSTI